MLPKGPSQDLRRLEPTLATRAVAVTNCGIAGEVPHARSRSRCGDGRYDRLPDLGGRVSRSVDLSGMPKPSKCAASSPRLPAFTRLGWGATRANCSYAIRQQCLVFSKKLRD